MTRYARAVLVVFFAALLLTPVIIRRMGHPAGAGASTSHADAAGAVRLPPDRVGEGRRPRRRARGADARPEARAHHAAGRVDGRGGLRRRLRPRRLAGSLRHRQQGRLEEPPVSQPRRRHVRGRRRAPGRRRPQPRRRPACRWAPSGATTTTTASRICSSTSGAGPELFHNDRGQGFTRVTDMAGLPAWANVNTAVWLDFDRDGRLDLFVGGYYAESINLWKLADTQMMPESFEYANNGGRKYLLQQSRRRAVRGSQRAGRAQLATLGAGRGRRRSPRHRLSRSLHRQRLRRVGALRQRSRTFPRNRPGRRRRLRAQERDERLGRRRVQPGPLRDLRDEHLRGGHPAAGQQPLGADGAAEEGVPKYENLARSMGVDLGGWSFGAQFGDLNNDGFLDLYSSTATSRRRGRRATGTTSRRSPAATSSSSPTPGTGRRWAAGAWPATSRRSLDQRRRRPVPRRRADGRRDRSLRRPRGRACGPLEPRRARRGRRQPARAAAAVPQRGRPGTRVDRVRPRGRVPA